MRSGARLGYTGAMRCHAHRYDARCWIGLAAWSAGALHGTALAGTSIIANGAAEVFAGAGASNNTIDTVQFKVPGANVGDGTAIAGLENGTTTTSLIDASARAPAANSRTAVWTVDSSQPLTCITPATCGGTTIPMTKFRWTSSGGNEVASGSFNGSTNQNLFSFQNSRYVYVYKTFYYINDEIVPAGQYSGRVVYTVSMP